MGYNNVNVNVSGPVQPTSTYKTKVLKGNHSFASQVTEPNMKYVIKHNFDLGGDVTIPENCILEFDGGSLGNGTITGNKLTLDYLNSRITPSSRLVFSGINGLVIKNFDFSFSNLLNRNIDINNCNDVVIRDGILEDGSDGTTGHIVDVLLYGIYIKNCNNCLIQNVRGYNNQQAWPIYVNNAKNLKYDSCYFSEGFDGIKLTGVLENVCITNNTCIDNIRDGFDFAGYSINGLFIENNIFIHNAELGLGVKTLDRSIYPIPEGVDNIEFTNIFIINNTIALGNTRPRYNVNETSTSGIELWDKYSTELDEKPIVFVSGNTIIDQKYIDDSTITHIGFNLTLSSVKDKFVVCNNTISNEPFRGFKITNTAGITIKDNNCLAKYPIWLSYEDVKTSEEMRMKNIQIEKNKFVGTRLFTFVDNDNPSIKPLRDSNALVFKDNILEGFTSYGDRTHTSFSCIRFGTNYAAGTTSSVPTSEKAIKGLTWEATGGTQGAFGFQALTDNEDNTNDIRAILTYAGQGSVRPTLINGSNGTLFFDTSIGTWGFWRSNRFNEYDGSALGVSRSGTFADKPSSSDIYIGFKYFCTDRQTTEGATDGIEIIHKGNNVWVDALGRVVS